MGMECLGGQNDLFLSMEPSLRHSAGVTLGFGGFWKVILFYGSC